MPRRLQRLRVIGQGNTMKTKKTISLSCAEESDCEIIWRLRNDKSARKYFSNSEYIPYKHHKRWYWAVRQNKSDVFLIARRENKKVGYVRFDKSHRTGPDISIVIDKQSRGQGIGSLVLKMAIDWYFDNFPDEENLFTEILKDNISSNRIFVKCGFVKIAEDKTHYMYKIGRNKISMESV